jgi:hypothetical protein
VLHDGDPLEAAERLRSLLGTGADQSGGAAVAANRPRIAAVRLFDAVTRDVHKGQFRSGEAMAVEVDLAAPAGTAPVQVRLAVTGPADVPMWVMGSDSVTFSPDGMATVRFTVKELPPVRGIFALALAVQDAATGVAYDVRRFSEAFVAVGDPDAGVLEVAWTADQIEPPEAGTDIGRAAGAAE